MFLYSKIALPTEFPVSKTPQEKRNQLNFSKIGCIYTLNALSKHTIHMEILLIFSTYTNKK